MSDMRSQLDTSDALYGSADDLASQLIVRHAQLKRVKLQYEPLHQEIAKFVNPRREDIQRTDQKGIKRGKDVYDGTALGALNTWVDGMQGAMVSEAIQWFRTLTSIKELKDDKEVLRWHQEFDEAMYDSFRRSNFYDMLPEWFRDAGSVGTGTPYTEEDFVLRTARHTVIHPGELYIAEDAWGRVDTVHREFKKTARQIVQKFTRDAHRNNTGNIPPEILTSAKDNPETEYTILHCVFPNTDRDIIKLTASGKVYSSVYLSIKGKKILRLGGNNINPYTPWRLRKNSDEVWGYSQAADAIVEIRTLNGIGKTNLKVSQLQAEPPMNIPEEMRGRTQIKPRGRNYFTDPQRVMSAIRDNIRLEPSLEREKRLQESIEAKYGVEFFLMLARSEREMTLGEVIEKLGEKAVLMASQASQMMREALIPIFNKQVIIEARFGNLPEIPPQLEPYIGQEAYRIDFIGELARAQRRLLAVRNIMTSIESVTPVMQIEPSVVERFDWHEIAEELADQNGMPRKFMRSDEEVDAILADKAKRAAIQQALELAETASKASRNLAKGAEEGSPLEALVGAGK
ncbi:MAG TPA: hypothetical protein ENH94_03150 [Phycisphaerales bacterium]|nr:hypothetical protein [Phycisphaerales bacterium]